MVERTGEQGARTGAASPMILGKQVITVAFAGDDEGIVLNRERGRLEFVYNLLSYFLAKSYGELGCGARSPGLFPVCACCRLSTIRRLKKKEYTGSELSRAGAVARFMIRALRNSFIIYCFRIYLFGRESVRTRGGAERSQGSPSSLSTELGERMRDSILGPEIMT